MSVKLTQDAHHLASSTAALRGEKREVELKHKNNSPAVKIWQEPGGDWKVKIGSGQHAMPATDVEVALWLENLELRKQLQQKERA
jgi:hypothetical protein